MVAASWTIRSGYIVIKGIWAAESLFSVIGESEPDEGLFVVDDNALTAFFLIVHASRGGVAPVVFTTILFRVALCVVLVKFAFGLVIFTAEVRVKTFLLNLTPGCVCSAAIFIIGDALLEFITVCLIEWATVIINGDTHVTVRAVLLYVSLAAVVSALVGPVAVGLIIWATFYRRQASVCLVAKELSDFFVAAGVILTNAS